MPTSKPLDPRGPEYGLTSLQAALMRRYLAASQRDPLPWPSAANERTSMRALVRRRLMSRDGGQGLFPSERGRTAEHIARPA